MGVIRDEQCRAQSDGNCQCHCEYCRCNGAEKQCSNAESWWVLVGEPGGLGQEVAAVVTATTAVKSSAGRVAKISVVVADGAVSVHDAATTGAAATANKIVTLPDAVGVYSIDFPCANGIVVVPNGSTVAVSFN